MNRYARFHDYSLCLLDLGITDPALIESIARTNGFLPDNAPLQSTPTHHRHDGASPLPLGMDWSPPPAIWEGRNSVWPHDFHTGWSYCVTIPSWTIIPKARGLDPIVFYRLQVGIQSPEGISSSRWILRRFSDFLKLLSDIKKEFPKKKLPPVPPKGLLKIKSKDLIEERRCSLGDWTGKLLSDIDISRSVTVGIFLELEAAARSSFYVANQTASVENSPPGFVVPTEDMLNCLGGSLADGLSFTPESGEGSGYEASDRGTPTHGMKSYPGNGVDNATHNPEATSVLTAAIEDGLSESSDLRPESVRVIGKNLHDQTLLRNNETDTDQYTFVTNLLEVESHNDDEMEHVPKTEYHSTRMSGEYLKSELTTSKPEVPRSNDSPTSPEIFPTDVEGLVARLDQELAVREQLSTKVRDLELELESMKSNREESLEQAIGVERERVMQVQWDMEELRRKCLEMELKLKIEEDKYALDSSQKSITFENDRLWQALDAAREQVSSLLKQNEDLEAKSKLELRTLANEVKSLRSSQSELRQELVRLTNEKGILEDEAQRRELSDAANAKLLREYQVLRSRLEECRVSLMIEEGNKLTIDTSNPSEAIDLLGASDNRIGLLLAEAQLLAEAVENADDEIRKTVRDVLVDNAGLRMRINSVLRCAMINTQEL